jgi:hypothetical protein
MQRKLNWFVFVSVPLGIVLRATGLVSWWTWLLIVVSGMHVWLKSERRRSW